MESHTAGDISIRKVAVRLNDTNINSEMNGGCVNSLYIPAAVENDTEVTCFNEESEEKCVTNHSEIANDLEGKLHICKESTLVNGCIKQLHEDIQKIDFSNKKTRDTIHELIKTGGDSKISERTHLAQSTENIENERTENDSSETETIAPDTDEIHLLESIKTNEDLKPSKECPELCSNTIKSDLKICSNDVGVEEVSITYLGYESEIQMPDIMRLIQKDLSEPYSIYTYRYFIHNWPKLCFLAQHGNLCVGAIVCKLDVHKKQSRRGYIAMLAVDEKYRKRKIGSNLVLKAINAMEDDGADEVVLETEITNKSALRLYENLGFVRDKRLFRYYLNGVDALRLKLWLK